MQEPMLIKWGPLDKLKRKTKSYFFYFFLRSHLLQSYDWSRKNLFYPSHVFSPILGVRRSALVPPCHNGGPVGYRQVTTAKDQIREGTVRSTTTRATLSKEGTRAGVCLWSTGQHCRYRLNPCFPDARASTKLRTCSQLRPSRFVCFLSLTPPPPPSHPTPFPLFGLTVNTHTHTHFNISSARRRLLLFSLVRNSLAVPVDFEEFFCTRAFDYCTFALRYRMIIGKC